MKAPCDEQLQQLSLRWVLLKVMSFSFHKEHSRVVEPNALYRSALRAKCRIATAPQEELSSARWQQMAPCIDIGSYLVADDGSNRLNAVGKEVAFVLAG